MDTVYRAVPFELTELKATDAGWQFSGYCSTYGNVDQGGDVVMRGAFDASLTARKKRPLLWQHDLREPIGVETSLKSDDRGLIGTWKIIDTARGSDAHKLLKAGAIDSMSIGYLPTELEFDDVGVRKLTQVDLLECSLVTLPMNEQALVTQVKRHQSRVALAAKAVEDLFALDEDEPFGDVLAQIRGFLKVGTDAAEALQARRAADSRALADGHLQAIDALVVEAKASIERLARLAPGQPEAVEAVSADDLHARLELSRRVRDFRTRRLTV